MIWQQVKVLIPSMLVHLGVTVAICLAVWYFLKQYVTGFSWTWKPFVVFGVGISVFHTTNTLTQFFQNGILQERQAQMAQEGQKAAVDAELKMRDEFLKNIDALAQNPSLGTPENKQALQQAFAVVFNNPQVREEYAKNILNLIACQKIFLQDAIASREKGQQVKSQDRATCESLPGNFFNRAKLVPDEMAQQNGALITALAGASRAPASEKEKLPTLEQLKQQVAAQEAAYKAIANIFQ